MKYEKLSFDAILSAKERLKPYLTPTPLRNYSGIDKLVGNNIRVYIKHENYLPTNSFKYRNGLSAITALSPEEKVNGVVAATLGNHGQGVALAGTMLGVKTNVCVPIGNNPDKNDAIRNFGGNLIEIGKDYDEAVEFAKTLQSDGMTMIHSVNNLNVIAGAGTLSLELLEQQPDIEALVLCIGGGTHAVGAITVVQAINPKIQIYGVQAEGAPANHDAWHSKIRRSGNKTDTFADGVRTRNTYEMTYQSLQDGLSDFITVSDSEIAEAIRIYLKYTHNLAEGAGAIGLAGLIKLSYKLRGKKIGIVLTGSNIDQATLKKVINNEL
jgi:threonine dehydratase